MIAGLSAGEIKITAALATKWPNCYTEVNSSKNDTSSDTTLSDRL
jgi:hypothetical protein